MKHREAVDIVIVGAGAAGSVLAAKLSEGGKTVVVLETGPPWEFKDLYSSEIWSRRLKYPSSLVVNQGSGPLQLGYSIGGGFGGTALHHFAQWFRLHPEDFKEYSLYGQNLDWPITYDDLRPSYDQIQSEIGISGDAEAETTRPAGAPYPMPPIPQFAQGKILAKGFASLGIGCFPQPLAINTVEFKGRNECLYDGWCDAGCPIGALANPLAFYIPAARAAGAEFRAYSTVTKILTDSAGGKASGVVYRDGRGEFHFQPASAVILASFAIQTPRLLLNSATNRSPAGLANSSDTVGRYITTHASIYVYGLFNEDTEPYKGVTGGSLASQDGYSPKQKSNAFGSYTLLGGGASLKPNDLIGIAGTRPELFGAALDDFMQNASHHIGVMTTLTETRPLPQNRVTLSHKTDQFGLPLPTVTHEYDSDSLTNNATAAKVAGDVFSAAGATQIWNGQMVGQHIMGGTIMGSDPTKSVTNGYGQTHDVPNLFIAGTGLFPTIGAANPTYTVHALALRTAEHLLSQWSSITT